MQVVDHPFKGGAEGGFASIAVAVMDRDFISICAIQDDLQLFGRYGANWGIQVDLVFTRGSL